MFRISIREGEEDKPGSVTIDSGTVTGNTYHAYVPEGEERCFNDTYHTAGTVEYEPDDGCATSSCGSQNSFGSGTVANHSVDFRLHLGATTNGESAGFLWLEAESPSTSLYLPTLLRVPFARPGVEVIPPSGGSIQQVKVPQGLVKVIATTDEYSLECFYATQIGSKVNGLYTTVGSPFVTWIVGKPEGENASNRLHVIEQRDSNERVFEYTYTTANSQWDLVKPDGQTLSTWKVGAPPGSAVTNYFEQVSSGGQVLRKVRNTYKFIPAINGRVLTQVLEGDGAVTKTTTYEYYTSGNGINQVQWIDYPEGDWVYYTYDESGRKLKEYSAYNNSARPSGEPDPLVDHCRETEYTYGTHPWIPYHTSVKLPVESQSGWELHEVSSKFADVTMYGTSDPDDEERNHEIISQSIDPGVYLTTATYTSRMGDITAGRPMEVFHPDQTITTNSYPDQFTTVQTGPDGTETTNVVDDLGKLMSSTRIDLATDVVLSRQTYTYTNSSGEYFDPLRRSYDVTDLAGRKTQYRYQDCCGVYSVTDPDGLVTTYDYDVLGRQVAVTQFYGSGSGIKTTNILDAVGHVLQTKRIGSNGSPIMLSQAQYDVLGRTIRQTNALNGVSTITNVVINHQLYITNTYPDGGTRVEAYQRDGRLQSVTGTAVFPVKYVYSIEADSETGYWRECTQEIKLNADGSETGEWKKSYVNGVGNVCKTIYADPSGTPSSKSSYNSYGQLEKQTDADGVVTLYQYNSYGELEYTAVDLNTNGTIDVGGNDRITRTERVVATAAGSKPNLVRVNTHVWKDGESTGTLVSSSETSTDGLRSWQTIYREPSPPVTNWSHMVYSTGGNRYLTNMSPDGSYTLTHYTTGRLASVTQRDSAHNQVTKTTYGYDAHGRQNAITDARNGATTYSFNDADLVTSATSPAPASDQPAQTTLTYYDKMSRVTNTISPDGGSVTNEYFPTGLLKKTYGSRTYPVEYTYDYAGRMNTMKTWQDFAGNTGTATTTWNYDAYRGWLANKRYADSTGLDYANTAGGRLKTRVWARIGTSSQRVLTTYKYGFDDTVSDNQHGDLTETSYTYDPHSTPAVTMAYDRLGRPSTITQGSITTSLTYNNAGQPLVESYSGGTLNGLSVTNGYDQFLRRTNLTALNGSTILARTTNSYDTAGRLAIVSDGGAHSATYGYLANSPLVSTVTFRQNNTTRMTTTKSYDYLNRLTTINSAPGGSGAPPLSYAYAYNSANQRTRRTETDGSYWSYEYDTLGQVTRGAKFFKDGYPVPGQQFEYAHDDIGNRKSTKAGGDENGANLRSATNTPNNLNQYTSRTVPGAFDVLGLAMGNNSTLQINGSTPWRKGEYFRKELSVNNDSAPVWQAVSVAATGESTVTGNVFVPRTPEAFTYDADGNLTQDGRWDYTWDAENRVVKMESRSDAPSLSKYKLEFVYDSKGRRIQKLVSTNNGSVYVAQSTNRFVYDGWNLVAMLNPQSSILYSFTWGLDLSGTLQGAGGVGGLLSVSNVSSGLHFCGYDGNGNVAVLANGTDGSVTANYEYGPFGETLRVTGTMAKANPFRFSAKFQDDESDFLYYGYRSYNPTIGRWLSRDPLYELGHQTLFVKRSNRIYPTDGNGYLFVDNNPVLKADPDGRSPIIVGGAVVGIVVACAYPQFVAAFSRYEDSGDKFKHCWVSCRISKTCGAGISQLAGLGKEVRDRAIAAYCEHYPDSEVCDGGHGDFWDSIDDIAANQKCMGWESRFGPVTGWIGALCRRSCEDCCKEKVGYHTGE